LWEVKKHVHICAKVKVTESRSQTCRPSGGILFNPLSGVDRDIQSATETLPLKGGGVDAAHSINCSPVRRVGLYASC